MKFLSPKKKKSYILTKEELENMINTKNNIDSLSLNSFGAFISYEYINSKIVTLGCSETLFKLFLLILDKYNLSPLGKEIFFNKKDTFRMENLEITIKVLNKDEILKDIFNDFKEDFDYIFDETMTHCSNEEKCLFIFHNYKDFYGEPLNTIFDYRYEIKNLNTENYYISSLGDSLFSIAENLGIDINKLLSSNPLIEDIWELKPNQKIYLPSDNHFLSKDILEEDLSFFLKKLEDDNSHFIGELSKCYFKGILYHFLYIKDTKNLYENMINFDIYKNNCSFIDEEKNNWIAVVLSQGDATIVKMINLRIADLIQEIVYLNDSYI